VKYHESRGGQAPATPQDFAVAPYLHPQLRRQLAADRQPIERVIVGKVSLRNAIRRHNSLDVEVEFKANLVMRDGAGPQRNLLIQQFVFRRPLGVVTRAPEAVLALGCPACGTRQEPEADGRCRQCGQVVGNGAMDWQVIATRTGQLRPVTEPVGQGGGVEVGTDLPTVIDPMLAAGERHLSTLDPSFDWEVFRHRVATIFMKLQEGWTRRDEGILRPYELDHVFDTHRIWLERYREQGVRNVLDDVQIDEMQPVKVEGDAWYDSITMRIFASMIDYNVRDDGSLISGDRTKRKAFSEYFTLIRRASRHGRASADPLKCPQCGAPLDRISQLGICGYCDSRITTGEFDWVLAEITQDEEYGG